LQTEVGLPDYSAGTVGSFEVLMSLASVYPPRAKELKRIIVPLINSWYKWNVTPASETQGTCVLETLLFKQIRKNIQQDSLNTTSISKERVIS
jgi:hypothetical protein